MKIIRRILRFVFALLGLLGSAGLAGLIAFRLVNRTNGWLVSSGERRRYLLYVPRSYNSAVPTPLVISIHGFAEWPAHQAHISRWNLLADEHGFLVVYPMGTKFPLRWRTSPSNLPHFENTKWGRQGGGSSPEVTFISALIDRLAARYNIDPRRIYANGLSNGGGMSFTLACELSGRIAAVGGVAGGYLYPWESCKPSHPVPMILFHGTADPIVPYHGGPSRSFNIPFPNIPQWAAELARRNGCDPTPEAIPPVGAVSGVRYGGCPEGAEVVFYTIDGGGHTWPGGNPLPEFLTGKTSLEIDASEKMWEFFVAHPLPEEN